MSVGVDVDGGAVGPRPRAPSVFDPHAYASPVLESRMEKFEPQHASTTSTPARSNELISVGESTSSQCPKPSVP